MTREQLSSYFTNSDLLRLEQYAKNMVDYHLITDLLPKIAQLYFTDTISSVKVLFLFWYFVLFSQNFLTIKEGIVFEQITS